MRTVVLFILLWFWTAATYSNEQAWKHHACNSMMEFHKPCELVVGKNKIQIIEDGQIRFLKGETKFEISVDLPEGFSFEIVRSVKELNGIAYFSIEITDVCSSSSLLFALDIYNQSLLWQTEIPAFNSSKLLISDNSIYVGGIGYVARIDKNTGENLWFIDSLYERDTRAYNSFSEPFISGKTVIFPESQVGDNSYIRTVVVDIQSGVLISK